MNKCQRSTKVHNVPELAKNGVECTNLYKLKGTIKMSNNNQNVETYKKGAVITECPFMALRIKHTRSANLSDITNLINSVSLVGISIKGKESITLTNKSNTKHYELSGENRKNLKKALNSLAGVLVTIQDELYNLQKTV